MKPTARQEETPLLLLFLEDSSASPRRKNFFGNNSRYNRISEGASTVFTQWPAGQVTICCLATFVFLMFFLTFMMIMLATSFHPNPNLPRCHVYKYNDNNSKIYLVHHGEWQLHQFETIEEIVADYPDIPIELTDLWNRSQMEASPTVRSRCNLESVDAEDSDGSKHKYALDIKDEVFIGANSEKRKMSPKIKHYIPSANFAFKASKVTSLKNLLFKYPIIIYNEETMDNFFSRTPLYYSWKFFNMEMAEFAARVLKIWEFGGISFKLPEVYGPKLNRTGLNKTQVYDRSDQVSAKRDENWKIATFIRSNLTSFINLPEAVVNIDDDGIHMETKTACHAFFGELLANMRKSNLSTATLVSDVVNATLKTFCIHGDVTDEFSYNYFASFY